MKLIITLLWLMSFAPAALPAPAYKHKSPSEIARMTPAQRVDEWVNEQVRHRYDLDDEQSDVIKKYVLRDGPASLPRIIEMIDEYDPARGSGRRGHKGERFDACFQLLGYIDNLSVRLRASEEGRRAMDALERAINRMSAAGFHQDQAGWPKGGRIEVASITLRQATGINDTDEAIRNTLRLEYKIRLADAELLEFSNFLVARHAEYPGWSERDFIFTIDENGKRLPGLVLKKVQPFYEAYLEFKKVNG
jgi:hypothetical protein